MTVAAMSISCSGSTPTPTNADPKVGASDRVPDSMSAGVERKYLLERVDEAAVVQLYADGFEALPVEQRILMVDPKAFRDGVGTLLAEVQRIKANGDYPAAKALFDTYGIHFDAALRDEIVARVDRLKLPSYTGFVQPKLEPVRDGDGTIRDVKITYPQDLTRQMLEYSEATRASREQFRGR